MTAEVSSSQLWIKRPLIPADFNFVVFTWLSSAKHSPTGLRMGAHRSNEAAKRFWIGQERVSQSLVEHCNVTVCEAEAEEGGKVIVGWMCWEPDCIHFVLTRRKFAHMGVAKDLLSQFDESQPMLYSHLPATRGIQIPANWQYDPYRALAFLGK